MLPCLLQLWHAYLTERLVAVRGLAPSHPAVEALNNTFERAMVSMHKMPVIWTMYLEFLLGQRFVTRTRRLFDRALTSLPVTQHERVWPLYLRFIGQPGIPVETAVRVYRRYLKLEPTHAEEFIQYLKIKQLWGEAARVSGLQLAEKGGHPHARQLLLLGPGWRARCALCPVVVARAPHHPQPCTPALQRLAGVVNDEGFRSLEGKSRHQLWLELCDMVTRHPNEVKDMKVEAILRSGIRRFTDEVWPGAMRLCSPAWRCGPLHPGARQPPAHAAPSRAAPAAHACHEGPLCRWDVCGPPWPTTSSGGACLSGRATCTRRGSPRW
jgi:pre-mRNA-splicing factor SYF1